MTDEIKVKVAVDGATQAASQVDKLTTSLVKANKTQELLAKTSEQIKRQNYTDELKKQATAVNGLGESFDRQRQAAADAGESLGALGTNSQDLRRHLSPAAALVGNLGNSLSVLVPEAGGATKALQTFGLAGSQMLGVLGGGGGSILLGGLVAGLGALGTYFASAKEKADELAKSTDKNSVSMNGYLDRISKLRGQLKDRADQQKTEDTRRQQMRKGTASLNDYDEDLGAAEAMIKRRTDDMRDQATASGLEGKQRELAVKRMIAVDPEIRKLQIRVDELKAGESIAKGQAAPIGSEKSYEQLNARDQKELAARIAAANTGATKSVTADLGGANELDEFFDLPGQTQLLKREYQQKQSLADLKNKNEAEQLRDEQTAALERGQAKALADRQVLELEYEQKRQLADLKGKNDDDDKRKQEAIRLADLKKKFETKDHVATEELQREHAAQVDRIEARAIGERQVLEREYEQKQSLADLQKKQQDEALQHKQVDQQSRLAAEFAADTDALNREYKQKQELAEAKNRQQDREMAREPQPLGHLEAVHAGQQRDARELQLQKNQDLAELQSKYRDEQQRLDDSAELDKAQSETNADRDTLERKYQMAQDYADANREREAQLDQLARDEKMAAEERLSEQRSANDKMYQAVAVQSSQIIAGAAIKSFQTMAKGQKAQIGMILEGIGDQAVAMGTMTVFDGIAKSILLDPRGPPLIGIGGAEVAFGMGLGAVGAHGAGGSASGGGKAQDNPYGANPYSNPQSPVNQNTGPTIININMPTVLSPSAEDGLRVQQALDAKNRVYGR